MSATLNWRSWTGFTFTAFTSLVMFAVLAQAQPPGRFGGGRDGDRDRGSGSDRGSGERSFGGERRFERGGGDGRGGFSRGGYGRGSDERRGSTPSSDSSGAGSSSPGSSRAANSTSASVQGFGSTDKSPQAPGFNVPLEAPGGNLQNRYDKQVLDKADKEVMPRFDRDKDGYLSLEESKESDWTPPFADSDLDKDGRLSRFELYERYAKKLNLPPKTAVVMATAGGGSRPTESSAGGGDDQSKVAEYVKGFLVQHDANKSGVLEKDEWKNIKAEHHSADTNKDNVITQEELTVKFAGFATSGSRGSAAPSDTPASSPGGRGRGRGSFGGNSGGRDGERNDKGATTDARRSYRVPTATERLPKGLPDWFARNDTDADGQVMMAEFMTEFTEAKAAEFAKCDLNGDGIITPDECLEVEGRAKKK